MKSANPENCHRGSDQPRVHRKSICDKCHLYRYRLTIVVAELFVTAMNFCDVDETKIQRRHVCWCRRWSRIRGGVGSPREKPVRWPLLGGCAILAQRWRPTRRRPRRTRHNSIKSFILICLSRACPDGEIGRRSGLKIRRPQGRGGSSPPLGTKDKTIKINNLQRHEPLTTGGAFVVQTALVPVLVPVCTRIWCDLVRPVETGYKCFDNNKLVQ